MYIFLLVSALVAAPELLVTTDGLAASKTVLIVDTRPLVDYQAAHIPGAAHVDVAQLSETRNGVIGLLRPVDQLRQMLAQAGIDPSKQIVVYAGMKNAEEFKDATRLFWILDYLGYDRVSVLDGGLAKWLAEGRATETGESNVAPIELPALPVRDGRLASKDEVAEFLKAGTGKAIDLRPANEFSGADKHDGIARAGHLPDALNMPISTLFTSPSNTLKGTDVLGKMMGEDGVGKDTPVITYCNSGRQASVGYFVLRLLGHENVSLYDGSMAEWTADASKDVVQSEGTMSGVTEKQKKEKQ